MFDSLADIVEATISDIMALIEESIDDFDDAEDARDYFEYSIGEGAGPYMPTELAHLITVAVDANVVSSVYDLIGCNDSQLANELSSAIESCVEDEVLQWLTDEMPDEFDDLK